MRVTGNSFTSSMVDQLNLLSARQYRLQNQATSGQSIQAPEDNPAGMQQALGIQDENSRVSQYAKNIATLQDRATAASSVLQQLKTISDRITEIAAGVDGTTGSPEMQSDASLVTDYIKHAVQLMNSKSGGQYLFGGTNGQIPFVMTTDANGNVTGVTYQGDTGANQADIAENTGVTVDIPGQNDTGSGPRGVVSDSRYGADFFNHLISLQNHLQSNDAASVKSVDSPGLLKDEDNLIFQVASNGAMQSRLDAAATTASSRQTSLQKSMTNVAGADLTQTLVQLTQAQNSYQVALQGASKILQMQQSILNYLQ